MSTLAPTGHTSASLTFSFEGLGDKEQTLFKSFVRLLNHRTQQSWSYQPGHADLRVVGEGHPAALAAHGAPVLVLTLDAASRKPHHLPLPIHADALETELNLLGGLLALRRPGHGAPSSAASATAAAQTGVQPGERVRLSRWPSPSLLTSRERVRLATLMTGRPMSIEEVHQRSGVDEAVCSDFMSELDRAGVLLHDTPVATQPAPLEPMARTAATATTSLLARIRNRLGLGAASRA